MGLVRGPGAALRIAAVRGLCAARVRARAATPAEKADDLTGGARPGRERLWLPAYGGQHARSLHRLSRPGEGRNAARPKHTGLGTTATVHALRRADRPRRQKGNRVS